MGRSTVDVSSRRTPFPVHSTGVVFVATDKVGTIWLRSLLLLHSSLLRDSRLGPPPTLSGLTCRGRPLGGYHKVNFGVGTSGVEGGFTKV